MSGSDKVFLDEKADWERLRGFTWVMGGRTWVSNLVFFTLSPTIMFKKYIRLFISSESWIILEGRDEKEGETMFFPSETIHEKGGRLQPLETDCLGSDCSSDTCWLYDLGQGSPFSLSLPPFPHLQNGHSSSSSTLKGFLWGIR